MPYLSSYILQNLPRDLYPVSRHAAAVAVGSHLCAGCGARCLERGRALSLSILSAPQALTEKTEK